MDSESERSRQLQCWDGPAIVTGFVKQWTSSESSPDFEPDDGYCNALIDIGFNHCSTEVREFWRTTIKENYRGDEGRRRIRMAAINLAERGGLHLRLSDVRCPVLWLHVRLSKLRVRLMLNRAGYQRRRVLHGQCHGRDPVVHGIARRTVGASGKRCPFPKLLSPRRSGVCAFAVRDQVQIDHPSQASPITR